MPVGFDPKDNHLLDGRGFALVTPNLKEAYMAASVAEPDELTELLTDETLAEVGRNLAEKWDPSMLLITLGSLGMLVLSKEGEPKHIATKAREVFDVSGAGNTVIAVCMMALVAGASHEEAAELANHAAGIVVGKLGTATCSGEELLASFE